MSAGVTHCANEGGELVAVPAEVVKFRPTVCGILIDNQRVQRVILECHGPPALWRRNRTKRPGDDDFSSSLWN